MIDSYEFYRLIEDRVYGLIREDEEFEKKLSEMQIPHDIISWLVAHVKH